MLIKSGVMCKKRIIGITAILLILICTAIFFFEGDLRYNYKSIDKTTNEKLEALIKENTVSKAALQTSNCKVDWTEEGFKDQGKLSDDLLKGITIQGELKGKLPKSYIVVYCSTINIYIPYRSSSVQDKIILEAGNKLYVSKAQKDDVNAIIDYLKKQGILKK